LEAKQLANAIGALSFLASFAVLAASIVSILILKLLREERLSRWGGAVSGWLFGGRGLARKLAMAAALLVMVYGMALLGASAASREWALSPGEEKYFCEIDCHLAYSVAGVRKVQTVGSGSNQKSAKGTFFIVSLRTRFDEHTISSHRGDSPLTPSPRAVTLIDRQGQEYSVSQDAQQTLEVSLGGNWNPLTQALRPGESYITSLVFDLPSGVSGLKLLVASPTNPVWIGRVLIGDEASILHKKVYLRLDS
jgi:Domain of unknown function (DUF4352)